MEVARAGEGLADEMRANQVAVARDELAFSLLWEEDVSEAGNDERVADAQQNGGDESVENGGDEKFFHGGSLSETEGGDEHVDELDADERRDDAAETVDHKVAL